MNFLSLGARHAAAAQPMAQLSSSTHTDKQMQLLLQIPKIKVQILVMSELNCIGPSALPFHSSTLLSLDTFTEPNIWWPTIFKHEHSCCGQILRAVVPIVSIPSSYDIGPLSLPHTRPSASDDKRDSYSIQWNNPHDSMTRQILVIRNGCIIRLVENRILRAAITNASS